MVSNFLSRKGGRSLPSRERGLKYFLPPFVPMSQSSLPSRERGLKWKIAAIAVWDAAVAPFTGAWIEIVNLGGCYILVASLPSRERGLKFVAVGAQTNSFASLPSRERGLKFLQGRSCARSLRVAPFAEAWIEMRYTRLPRRRVMSLPSRSDTDSRIASLPSNLAPVPIPHNLSPTPTKTFAHVMTHVL